MSDIVSPLLQWLNANPEWAGVATFVISAAESVAIIGTLVPGSITMTAIGALAGAGVIPLWATLFWATLGAIVGDGISYWLGHYFKDKLRKMWPFNSNPGILEKGELFVHKHGVMSVFIGRFVGPVRALVPLVAGMLGMKPLQFTMANVTSAIGWAPAYMLPGILIGAASLELPPDIAVHVMLVVLLIGLFIISCVWFMYKLLQLVHEQTNQLQNSIWRRLKKSRYFSVATILLEHYNPNKTHGQLNLAFYFVVATTLLIILTMYVKFTGAANIAVNDAIFHLFRGIRTSTADPIMLNITLLGQKPVILPIVCMAFAWLAYCKRWRAALHALALGILASGSIFIVKNIVQSMRPWGIFQNPATYSMPSGHTTLAVAVYLGLAFLIASAFRPSRRWPIYVVAATLAVAISFSRMYLGAHWFTDIFSAWLLGADILILVIISYHRHVEKPIPALGISLVSLITLIAAFSLYHYCYFSVLMVNYAQVSWPSIQVPMKSWWEYDGELPAYRTSLFGFPSVRINIAWAGSIKQIEATLRAQNWVDPPARDWISTIHRIADIKSTQYLPMISPQYLDNKPTLTLTRQTNDEKKLLVIRLWNSNRTIENTNTTIWVGVAGVIPRSYSWIFKNRQDELDITPDMIFSDHAKTSRWEWNMAWVNQPIAINKTVRQKIILIRQK
jgi:membrane protein DedA with SNARE-associated domain/membrane-associated phospholipid phosphatase